MGFDVAADAYDRFMGRFSRPLAVRFAEWAGVRPGQCALDVGCGPGALTRQLATILGAAAVTSMDPSESFLAALRDRCPDVDARLGTAEAMPFPDALFDVSLAQLVVHFMTDPVRGLVEMARVTRPGGVVAACVWDFGGGRGPLSPFWRAVRDLDPDVDDESGRAGAREGHLAELFATAGLRAVEAGRLTARTGFATFAEWWEPYTYGVGPAGDYVAGLTPDDRAALRARCAQLMPASGFEIEASAWTARGRA